MKYKEAQEQSVQLKKQLANLKNKSQKVQKKLNTQQDNLQKLINKLDKNTNVSKNYNHELTKSSKLSQIKHLGHEYKVASKFIRSNKFDIDSTILALIYKRLLKITPKWLPRSCKMKSLKERNTHEYIKLTIDKHTKEPRLLLDRRYIPNCQNEIINMPFKKLYKSIMKTKKFYNLRVCMMFLIALPTIFLGAFGLIYGSFLCLILFGLLIGILSLIAPKKFETALESSSCYRRSANVNDFYDILTQKQSALENYKTYLKDLIQNKEYKSTTTVQHLNNIEHRGTTWNSIEKHTD